MREGVEAPHPDGVWGSPYFFLRFFFSVSKKKKIPAHILRLVILVDHKLHFEHLQGVFIR